MQILWALVHALERISKRMSASIGVTGPQRLVLRVVGLAPRLSAGELAKVLHVHPSTLTGVLERLVSQGLLLRVPDARDRRRTLLALTRKGGRINDIRHGTAETAVADALDTLSAADRRSVKHALTRLAGHLDRSTHVDRHRVSPRR